MTLERRPGGSFVHQSRSGLRPDDDADPHHGFGVHHVAGEQITERGIGNGMSLLIFAGIVVGLPRAVFDL